MSVTRHRESDQIPLFNSEQYPQEQDSHVRERVTTAREAVMAQGYVPANYRVVRMDKLHDSPHHPRRHLDIHLLHRLTDSVADHGMLQAPVVRPMMDHAGHYEIIVGSRRIAAGRRLGQSNIEVRIIDVTDVDALILALADDLHHRHIAIGDKMDAYITLADILGTQAAVADRLHVSKTEVCKCICVARHSAARTAVCEGRISLDHAYEILASHRAHEADDILAGVLASEQTHRQTRALIKTSKGGKGERGDTSTSTKTSAVTALARPRTPSSTNDPEVLVPLAGSFSACSARYNVRDDSSKRLLNVRNHFQRRVLVVSSRNDVSSHDNTVSEAPRCIDVSRLSVSTTEQQETVAADDLTILHLYRDTDNANLADVWRALRIDVAMIDARVTMCVPGGDA